MPILIVCVAALVLRALGVAAEGHSVERLRVSSALSREFAGRPCVGDYQTRSQTTSPSLGSIRTPGSNHPDELAAIWGVADYGFVGIFVAQLPHEFVDPGLGVPVATAESVPPAIVAVGRLRFPVMPCPLVRFWTDQDCLGIGSRQAIGK